MRYFKEAPPEDAAWAAAIFAGNKLIKSVPSSLLRQLVSEETSLPPWLIDECFSDVGDLSETISLLLPDREASSGEPLCQVIANRILPLDKVSRVEQAKIVRAAWQAPLAPRALPVSQADLDGLPRRRLAQHGGAGPLRALGRARRRDRSPPAKQLEALGRRLQVSPRPGRLRWRSPSRHTRSCWRILGKASWPTSGHSPNTSWSGNGMASAPR